MESDMLAGDTAILQPYFQMLAQMIRREMGEEIGGYQSFRYGVSRGADTPLPAAEA